MNGDLPVFPSAAARAHLATVPVLDPALVAAFRRDGHVVVPRALEPDVVHEARATLLASVRRSWPRELAPIGAREGAYSQAFVQVVNPSIDDACARVFVHAPRIAGIGAQLMGVDRVRLFAENWLIKEAGARYTPWHQDGAVFPFEPCTGVTVWIPIEDMLPRAGMLRVAAGSHLGGIHPHEDISEESQAVLDRYVELRGYEVREVPPLRAGDLSFHDARTVHGAAPNDSGRDRYQLALHLFADGATVMTPTTGAMAHALADYGRGLVPGDAAVSDAWRLLFPSPIENP